MFTQTLPCVSCHAVHCRHDSRVSRLPPVVGGWVPSRCPLGGLLARNISATYQQASPRKLASQIHAQSTSCPAEVYDYQECEGLVQFPMVLPILPFTPNEVLPPSATKTLHMSDAQYADVLKDVMRSDHRLFVHTAVELGAGSDAASTPGAYKAGDFTFYLSTLVQVVHMESSSSGNVVVIRGEGRVQIKRLTQLQPYIAGVVEPVQDKRHGLMGDSGEGWLLQAKVQELKAILKDVYGLTSKFGFDEAAGLHDAMVWVEEPEPVMCNLSSLSGTCKLRLPREALPRYSTDSGTGRVLDGGSNSSSSGGSNSGSSTWSNGSGADASPGMERGHSGAHPDSAGHHGLAVPYQVTNRVPASRLLTEPESQPGSESEAVLDSLDAMARLSFAALEALPQSSSQELARLVQLRKASVCTLDTYIRLQLLINAMAEARSLWAAKCALKGLKLAA